MSKYTENMHYETLKDYYYLSDQEINDLIEKYSKNFFGTLQPKVVNQTFTTPTLQFKVVKTKLSRKGCEQAERGKETTPLFFTPPEKELELNPTPLFWLFPTHIPTKQRLLAFWFDCARTIADKKTRLESTPQRCRKK